MKILYGGDVMNNYEVVSSYIDDMLKEFYQMIERNLEYIINSPSTINSIIRYYKIAVDEEQNYYLVFNNEKIIRRWGNPKNHYYQKLKLEMWCQMGLTVIEPTLIMPPK